MIKSIAVCGPFSDINLGDYAMLINNLIDIDFHQAYVFSYDEKFW